MNDDSDKPRRRGRPKGKLNPVIPSLIKGDVVFRRAPGRYLDRVWIAQGFSGFVEVGVIPLATEGLAYVYFQDKRVGSSGLPPPVFMTPFAICVKGVTLAHMLTFSKMIKALLEPYSPDEVKKLRRLALKLDIKKSTYVGSLGF